jgi:hypothetical protein
MGSWWQVALAGVVLVRWKPAIALSCVAMLQWQPWRRQIGPLMG